jgi:hypothetical protein
MRSNHNGRRIKDLNLATQRQGTGVNHLEAVAPNQVFDLSGVLNGAIGGRSSRDKDSVIPRGIAVRHP